MENSVGQCGHRQNKTYERAGRTHVKERAGGANRGTDQDESAKSSHQRRKGNEERIACSDVMMTAGKEMAELVGEQNGEQRESEGQAC